MKGERMSTKSEIEFFVSKKISSLQAYADSGAGKAVMAELRKGIGHAPGEIPKLFGIILMDMPEKFMSEDGNATKEEWAIYIALTSFAAHQQGFNLKQKAMHTEEKISIGRALAKLSKVYNDINAEKRMLQKLQVFATSKDMKEAAYHLRSMIRLLNGNAIPINYALLSGDLYEFQFSDGKNRVNLRWGQDFYYEKYNQENNI